MYKLPEEMRPELAKPLGRLYKASELDGSALIKSLFHFSTVASVGDKVTEILWNLGRVPEVQVVDGRENRRKRAPPVVPYTRLIRTCNPPGTITKSAINAIEEAFRGEKPVRVLVEGEEDLLAIPVVLAAPMSAGVIYGQPGAGIVLVRVTPVTKARNKALLAKMNASDSR
jgi:hypothetical protein